MLVTKLKMQRSPYGDSQNFTQTEHLKCKKNVICFFFLLLLCKPKTYFLLLKYFRNLLLHPFSKNGLPFVMHL